MKIGQPPGSQGMSSGINSGGNNAHNSYLVGSGGPVKAHHRQGIAGQNRQGAGGNFDDSRNQNNHSFNAQGTSIHHDEMNQGDSHQNQRSSPGVRRNRNSHHRQNGYGVSPTAADSGAGNNAASVGQNQSQSQSSNNSRSGGPRAPKNNGTVQATMQDVQMNMGVDSRSAATPQNENLSTSAETASVAKTDKASE